MDSNEKEQSLKLADHYFREKNYQYAKYILDKVIEIDSSNSKANELLAYIHGNLGQFDVCFELLNVACKQNDCSTQALYYLGSIQLERGLFDQAIETFKKSIFKGGEFFEALHDLATAQAQTGDLKSALNNYQKCLKFRNLSHVLFFNIARIFDDLKRYEEALAHYDKALSLKPDYAEAWSNKGVTLHELKRHVEALANFDKALSLKPDYAEAWSNKGVTLHELKRHVKALANFDKALSLKPDYVEAWSNKGNSLQELKQYDEAIAHYDKALSLKPDYVEAWSNKGNTLHELKRYDEALAHYDKALSLKANYHEAWTNKGVTLHELKRYDEALAHYDKALSLKPDYADASWNKSLTLLLQGDFENGLPLYESRWDSEKVSEISGKRIFNKPTWVGVDSLAGKTILIYGEQGLGDFIQFCRYVKLVAELGANVILEVPQSLASLMKGMDGISKLVIKGEELPYFDYQCPLLSLPLAFRTNLTTIPCNKPYLFADSNKAAEWEKKLGGKRQKRIGLVWSSISSFKADAKRSLLLADFVRALPLDGFEYVCLQKELKECDTEFLKTYKHIRFFGDEFANFSDTAALIENLDLVISTCTSVPHLSGALGKETWVLLSHVPDWRWLLDRKDSPWYPSVKIYRQSAIGDWDSVFDKVKLDLSSGL